MVATHEEGPGLEVSVGARTRDPGPIPNYELLRFIRAGGFGAVWLARERVTGVIRAVKVLFKSERERVSRDLDGVRRYQQCAHNHPNLLQILTVGETERCFYYVMEAADSAVGNGQGVRAPTATETYEPLTLRRFAEQRGRLGGREALNIVSKLLAGVARLHAQNLAHYDLKPENVLLVEGEPRIADVGLVGPKDGPAPHAGTPQYLTPQREANDVYALGKVLYELITGLSAADFPRLPVELLDRPARELRSAVQIANRACALDPEKRYRSVAEFAGVVAAVLQRRRGLTGFWRRRTPKGKVALIVVGLASLALAGWSGTWAVRALRQNRVEPKPLARMAPFDRDQLLDLMVELEAGHPRNVLGPAEVAFQQNPELAEPRLLLAKAKYQAGVAVGDEDLVTSAVRCLDTAGAFDPTPWARKILLADVCDRTGSPSAAQGLRVEVEGAVPDTAEAWYLLSYAALEAPRALHCVEQALDYDPTHRLSWLRFTYLCYQMGDLERTLLGAGSLAELTGNKAGWLSFSGHVRCKQHRYEEAIECYNEVVRLAPDSQGTYRARAHAWRGLQRYEEALADYTRTIDLIVGTEAGVSGWLYCHRATVCWILGRREEAVADAEQARALLARPSYADARRFLILCELGRQAEAEQELEQARAGVRDAWLQAVFACLAGELQPAELITRADADNPEHICEAYYYAAEVSLRAGRVEEARAWYAGCLETGQAYDADSFPLDPMNEYDLARWRLGQLGSPAGDPSQAMSMKGGD